MRQSFLGREHPSCWEELLWAILPLLSLSHPPFRNGNCVSGLDYINDCLAAVMKYLTGRNLVGEEFILVLGLRLQFMLLRKHGGRCPPVATACAWDPFSSLRN